MKDDGRSKWEGDKSWPSHFLSDAHNTKGHTLLYQGRGTNSIDKVSICLNKERIYACSLFNDNVKVINMSIVQPHVTAEFTQVSFYHQGPSPVRKPSHHLSFKRLVEVINLCFFILMRDDPDSNCRDNPYLLLIPAPIQKQEVSKIWLS